ncbi:MAG: CDP-alcohol phosphatidyltransferase family protein [Saprospiraceae bacterium]|nr:CDP-alcohol phosphatidyltransferase family protein [Saprospiraceae bacterium]MCB0576967.1 CDP-alcohol phosphatidyltransferase family protein [Saprospiraceae bacterium]MCB9307862.1 CDP-alcohol phosphatidyltransferase family protein [Lewinellaceae bacterium]MCB9353215.1 CDP-alcohol phosphatidyltransferase family protein [Lewinellaceae bacterium]
MSNFLKDVGQPIVYKIINPFINLLLRIGITPNAITTIGFVINVVAAVVFVAGGAESRTDLRYVGWGGGIILFGGLFDMIDGRLARVGRMESRFGALYDSVLDRYSELAMFLGICYYLVAQSYFLSSLFAFIAMIGSMMVSYVRARAEGLGIECKGGLMQRPERILLIGISAVVCGVLAQYTGQFKYTIPGTGFPLFENITLFTFPIFIMAVLTNLTAIRRLLDSKAALDDLEKN